MTAEWNIRVRHECTRLLDKADQRRVRSRDARLCRFGGGTNENQYPRTVKLPIVQVAGIKDSSEAQLVRAAGIDWLGFPLRLDVHTPDLSEVEAANLIRSFDPETIAVVITYLNEADQINAFMTELGTRFVQLHGPISSAEIAKLRRLRPDAFITDTFDPATGASGATGKVHDWRISRELVELSKRPVILAGGLNPRNVREAISAVRPAGSSRASCATCHVTSATGARAAAARSLRILSPRCRDWVGCVSVGLR